MPLMVSSTCGEPQLMYNEPAQSTSDEKTNGGLNFKIGIQYEHLRQTLYDTLFMSQHLYKLGEDLIKFTMN